MGGGDSIQGASRERLRAFNLANSSIYSQLFPMKSIDFGRQLSVEGHQLRDVQGGSLTFNADELASFVSAINQEKLSTV